MAMLVASQCLQLCMVCTRAVLDPDLCARDMEAFVYKELLVRGGKHSNAVCGMQHSSR